MHRALALATGAILTAATGAAAQEMGVGGGMEYVKGAMHELDVDQDGLIDLGEFKTAFDADHFFRHWDRNGDGRLDKSEYVTAHFAMINLNRDDVIAKSEWDYSGRFWLEKDYNTAFDHWDADGDGRIQRGEFAKHLEAGPVFRLWDTNDDPGLSKAEVTAGIHSTWDRDSDDRIDETEQRQGPGRQGTGAGA